MRPAAGLTSLSCSIRYCDHVESCGEVATASEYFTSYLQIVFRSFERVFPEFHIDGLQQEARGYLCNDISVYVVLYLTTLPVTVSYDWVIVKWI
jgi:hypothetical protein